MQVHSHKRGDQRLKRLFWLRNVSIAGQALAIGAAQSVFSIDLPLAPLLLAVGALGLFNALTWWRLHWIHPVGDAEIFVQLAIDVLLLTAALYLAGGATNPFVSLYLLPLTIAATVLPARFAWGMAALTAVVYTLLMFHYLPLGHTHVNHSDAFGLHVLGMWFNFVVSAVLIAFFVVRMATSLRDRDRELAAARERALRDQQLVMLGMFAAGAAHELGTPLSTIAVVVKDLESVHANDERLAEDLHVLRAQVDACKRILTELVGRTGRSRSESARLLSLAELVDEAVSRWKLLRPAAALTASYPQGEVVPLVAAEETVIQALVSLINNAADASPGEVDLSCEWSEGEIVISVRDHGPGISEEAIKHAGKRPYSEKGGEGLGLGLLLANATIERLGGRIALANRDGGGVSTEVHLPIAVGAAA